MRELSAGHYCLEAIDCDGRSVSIEGSDDADVLRRAHIDTYLYDSMVLNKLLKHSMRDRNATGPLARFMKGYDALDGSPEGWHAFRDMLADLSEHSGDLTDAERRAATELYESLCLALPLLLAHRGGVDNSENPK